MGAKRSILSAHELHCPEVNGNNESSRVYETGSRNVLMGDHFGFVLEFSKDLICADSGFDSWINFSAAAIKRTVFPFSSPILGRNQADSSSGCDLGITCVLLSSMESPPI